MTGPTPTGPPQDPQAPAADPAAETAAGTAADVARSGGDGAGRDADAPADALWEAAGAADRPPGAEMPAGAQVTRLLGRLRTIAWWGPLSRAPLLAWRLGWGGLAGRVMAVVTTTGQHSGLPRRTVTGYLAAPGGERAYVAALYGPGSQWFRNLISDPRVTLQTTGTPRAMRARRVASDDDLRAAYDDLRSRVGPAADAALASLGAPGGLDGLLRHRGRVLLVRLDPMDPAGRPAAPAIRADLAWVPPLAALTAATAARVLARSRSRRRRRR